MRTHSFLYLCLFSILFWVSCKTLEPDRPEEIYVPFSRPPDLSVIQLPVALEAQQIMELLNENLNGLIYEDAEDAEDQILAKIWKQGDIKLSIQGNTVFWEIPLRVWVKAGYSLKQLGISLHEQKEFNAEVLMKFRTNTELLPSGDLRTQTETTGYEWIRKPTMRMMGMDIPITFLADYLMKSGRETIAKSLDKNLSEQFSLKETFSDIWKALHNPISINDEPPVWLSIQPKAFFSKPLNGNQNRLDYKAALSAYIYASVGMIPETPIVAPMPELQFQLPSNDITQIQTRLEITHEAAGNLANQALKGQKFEKDGRSVTIESVKVFGSEGMLAVEAEVSGSVKGRLFFRGKPFYDTITGSIRVSGLKFDLKTRNLLHKTASWILGTQIEKGMQKELVFNMEDQMSTLRSSLKAFLEGYRPAKGFRMQGHLERIRVGEIYMTRESIVAYISLNGTLGLKYERPSL